MYGNGTTARLHALKSITETDVMAESADCRPAGRGLHPSHFSALRTEILRTSADLSDLQLRDISDALRAQIRLRRTGCSIQRSEACIEDQVRAFA